MDNACILETRPLDLHSAREILAAAKISGRLLELVPLTGGANNRVFRLIFENTPSLILKSYFQHPQDPRPRLRVEFEFLSFAWKQGIRCIPEPLYKDSGQNCALYSYARGSLASAKHSTLSFVEAAAEFLLNLNRSNHQGKHLPLASEACLQISDYFEVVEKRINQLLRVSPESPSEQQLHRFLQEQLIPEWDRVTTIASKSSLQTLAPDPADLIITPSDFGLHNVIVSRENQYCFIDFEYAGWDDPAKTICDFFLQPRIPISLNYFEYFSKITASLSQHPQEVIQRAKRVLPICKIKWCCMILNIFLSTDKARRKFANVDLAKAQDQQLQVAKKYFSDRSTVNRPLA